MRFHIRRLDCDDIDLVLDLQQRIRDGLPDPTVFQPSSADFIEYCLTDGGSCYGAEVNGTTIAYLMIYQPMGREFNLAKDTSLSDAEYPYVAHWDTIAVLAEWRGRGISRALGERGIVGLEAGSVRHLFATSAPSNPHGVRSLTGIGLRPVRLVRKFDGKLRFLLYRTMHPESGIVPDHTESRLVTLSDTAALDDAFRAGWLGVDVRGTGASAQLELVCSPTPWFGAQVVDGVGDRA